MVAIFQNGRQNIHVLLSAFLINVEKRSWCLYTFSGPGIRENNLKDVSKRSDKCFLIVLLIYLQIIATLMQIRYAWRCFLVDTG